MNSILHGMSPRVKALIIIVLILPLYLFGGYWLGGTGLSAIMAIFAIIIFWITKAVWHSDDHWRNIIRLTSIGIAATAIGLYGTFNPWNFITPTLVEFLNKKFNIDVIIPTSAPPIEILVFSFLIILIVNYWTRDKTVMGEHRESIDKDFPEKDFKTKLQSYCKILKNELDNIDKDTNWSDPYFIPLDAEVEVISGNRKEKKVTDLLKAIKNDKRSNTFLVIGDPGAGKSVALRKLARELLDEVSTTGRIPIYINLREWQPKEKWSENSPPNSSELLEFVISNIKKRGDVFANNFVDAYFRKMVDQGRIFFLLDSFDEIPQVMDSSEGSWLLDSLSNTIYIFLAGMHSSRGILASRIFRKPTDKFKTEKILEIRPFTESQIQQNFAAQLSTYDQNILSQLFLNRRELIPIIRNPFTAALLLRYLQSNEKSLPDNQSELYKSYIDYILTSSKERLDEHGLTKFDVISYSTDIAYYSFESEHLGLEVDVSDLKKNLSSVYSPLQIDSIVNVLTYARLGRLSAGGKFSFVHRRFNEYFVVLKLIDNPTLIINESIPTDSRWRDALALYCEVADDSKVSQIANFCWMEIKNFNSVDYKSKEFMRSIHCLRFFSDALKGRKYILEPFYNEFRQILFDSIERENLLVKKLGMESSGLLNDNDLQKVVLNSFQTGNTWLYEIGIKSCRHLPEISKELEYSISKFISKSDQLYLLKNRRDLLFSFSLSDGFKNVKAALTKRIVELFFVLVFLIVIVLCNSFLALIVGIMIVGMTLVDSIFSTDGNGYKNRAYNIELMTRYLPSLMLVYSIIYNFISDSTPFIVNLKIFNPKDYLVILSCIAIFPYSIFIEKMRTTKQLFKILLSIVIYIVIYSFLNKFGKVIIDLLGDYKQIVGYSLLCVIGISILLFILIIIYLSVKNNLLIKSLKRYLLLNPVIDRAWIATKFYEIDSDRYRMKFVRMMILIEKPIGNWPDNKLPNLENDQSSTLLAQLEEKWLGLDR